jgi:16S rRNA (uracil1498-N3)-methyltransferase
MFRFYSSRDNIADNLFKLEKEDINHIKNVLRMTPGEKIIICDKEGRDYECEISSITSDEVVANIISEKECEAELDADIILFQGLPKKDKMELIIQKAVELGVKEIVPVATKNAVVKIENDKKEEKKLERWQSISLSAAKQSGRGIVPKVSKVVSFKEAISRAASMEGAIIPYEKAKGMEHSREVINGLKGKKSIAVFIGPEGGFDPLEIELALHNNVLPITLGKRILRTETAGLTILSILMYSLEN